MAMVHCKHCGKYFDQWQDRQKWEPKADTRFCSAACEYNERLPFNKETEK